MKSLALILTFFTATAALADAPDAYFVAASILKDSGITDATNVSGTHVGTEHFASETQTTHILHFDHSGNHYTCDFVFSANQTREDHYLVQSEMSNCRSNSGSALVLNNDYTSRNGASVFVRIFFDNNTKFRPLNAQERELVAGRRDRLSVDGAVKVINGRVIISSGNEFIPLN